MRVLPKDPDLHLIVYCDGAARGNPGPAGIGVVVKTASGRVLVRVAEGIGIATNNVAEYRAAIEGFRRARGFGARSVLLRSDSKLLVEQLSGRFKVKNPMLMRLHAEVRSLLGSFAQVRFEHVPREFNKEADRLANDGVDEWIESGGDVGVGTEPDPSLFD